MTAPDIDIIRDIPGYKVILKAVLKSQIQQLVEQLSSHTDEETVILTANVCDGSLSHLGSKSGRSFLEDHEDMKSQFLGFCLRRHHMFKENQKKDTNTLSGYSQDILRGSRSVYRSRNLSDSRIRGSPYHREKDLGQKLTLTHTSGSSVQQDETVTLPEDVDEVLMVNKSKGDNDCEPINKTENETCEPLDLNTNCNESIYPKQVEEHCLGTDNANTTSNIENSRTGQEEESISSMFRTGGVNIKTEPENDSDVEILTEVGQYEMSDIDNSWDMNSSAGMNFDPAGMAGSLTGQSEFTRSRWDPKSSGLSTDMTFDPAGIAGTSASTASVAYSFKKRFIGRQTSEQSHSIRSQDKKCFQTSQTWSEKTCNLKKRYLPVCDNISAFNHDTSEDISQVHDLSIKHERIEENDDNKFGETTELMYDGKQRRYKPVSRLTEAQRQRRRLMDRERQRRRRERIRAANLDFYPMYQY